MPSKSRKKIKGQARKAKAKAINAANNNNTEYQKYITLPDGALSPISIIAPNSMICSHGHQNKIPDVVAQFINTFFTSFYTVVQKKSFSTNSGMIDTLVTTLAKTYDNFSKALNKVDYRSIVKKNIISNGVSYLLKKSKGPSFMPLACAVTLMLIDTYDPSSPVPAGVFDEQDAKVWLKQGDIINGCPRSLIKYFVKRAPCKCLDDLYSQIKSVTPKMSKCVGCKQMKERNRTSICTGCERVTYCSKLCQLADVPNHKEYCKKWQSGKYTYDK